MNEQPKKKKHSLWWIWLLLILAAYAGGIVTGLKLNTLPLPSDVRDRLYPILESYIPGSTKTSVPAAGTPAPAETETPAVTESPVETEAPKPEETEAPVETPVPEPELIAAPAETLAPDEPAESAMGETPAAKPIGVNKALKIALQEAGAEDGKAEVNGVYRAKDEAGSTVYEVSFMLDGSSYDYVIDAFSGEVVSEQLSSAALSETPVSDGTDAAAS